MTSNHTPTDVLAYLDARVRSTLAYVTNVVDEDHRPDDADGLADTREALEVLEALADEVRTLAAPYTATTYSDGRPITSYANLCPNVTYCHHWHPDPTHGEQRTVPVCVPGGEALVTITPPGTLSAAVVQSATLDEAGDD